MDPANKIKIMTGGVTAFRDFKVKSQWIEMKAGQRYYVEGHHA